MYILQGLIALVYEISVRPYEDAKTEKLETINESVIYFCGIHALLLYQNEHDPDFCMMVGWSMIAFIGSNLLFNVGIVIYDLIVFAIAGAKVKYTDLKQKWQENSKQ